MSLAVAAFAAYAAPSPVLLDLAARVHYGYYHAEPRAIDAALAALERLGEAPDVVYYRDFATLRRAQFGGDLIERVLLLAPDYGAALDLQVAMQNARSGGPRL